MNVICKLNDETVLGIPGGESKKPPRLTARAVVKNDKGKHAVMYSDKFHLYSLPGGGVDEGEDIRDALEREIWEETGCTCDKVEELGIIQENRFCQDYTQYSYYYIVTTHAESGAIHLTDAEIANRTSVQWHDFETVYDLIANPPQDTQQRKYLQARDKAALDAYAAMQRATFE